MATETVQAVFDGCTDHRVGTKDVNDRWAMVKDNTNPLLGMCRCCYGPALVDSFDSRGIGQGEMLCSRCVRPPMTAHLDKVGTP